MSKANQVELRHKESTSERFQGFHPFLVIFSAAFSGRETDSQRQTDRDRQTETDRDREKGKQSYRVAKFYLKELTDQQT